MDKDQALKVEEFKEAGQEYRYRDQLMATEFGLGMTATAILSNAIMPNAMHHPFVAVVLEFVGLVFLLTLTTHLRHADKARLDALEWKNSLCKPCGDLPFKILHKYPTPWLVSAPGRMVAATGFIALVWGAWFVVSFLKVLSHSLSQSN